MVYAPILHNCRSDLILQHVLIHLSMPLNIAARYMHPCPLNVAVTWCSMLLCIHTPIILQHVMCIHAPWILQHVHHPAGHDLRVHRRFAVWGGAERPLPVAHCLPVPRLARQATQADGKSPLRKVHHQIWWVTKTVIEKAVTWQKSFEKLPSHF